MKKRVIGPGRLTAEGGHTLELRLDFWWVLLAVVLAGNVLNRVEAHLKGHPITVALFAGAGLYLVAAVLRDARGRDYAGLGANLLCLAGSVCFVLGYAHPVVNFWPTFGGYACFAASILFQILWGKWSTQRSPGAAPRKDRGKHGEKHGAA